MCPKNLKRLYSFVALLLLVSLSASFSQASTQEKMYEISETDLLRLLWIETRSGEINAELQKALDLSIAKLGSLQEELQALRLELNELKKKVASLEKSSSEAVEASLKAENSLKKLEESFDEYTKASESKIKELGKKAFIYKVLAFLMGAAAAGLAAHDAMEDAF
jgi:cell division septum initiation protein DivIVA